MQDSLEVDPGYRVLVLKGHCSHAGCWAEALAGTEKYPFAQMAHVLLPP